MRANGIDVHVEISGQGGPDLVCLHSLATDVDLWARQLPDLERHFRVIRIDLRGHGSTTATEPPYELGLLAADVLAVLDELGVQRTAVMGVSLGGILAMGLALDAPERIERIVVADCRADAPEPYVATWDGAKATARAEGLEPVIATMSQRWFSASFRDSHGDVVDGVRAKAVRTPLDGFLGCASAVQGIAYLPRLGELRVPALFVVGSEDAAAPPAVMRDMAERTPGAGFVELPGIGHLAPLEAGDGFTNAVLPFLTAGS